MSFYSLDNLCEIGNIIYIFTEEKTDFQETK